jgi:hypothetical protein
MVLKPNHQLQRLRWNRFRFPASLFWTGLIISIVAQEALVTQALATSSSSSNSNTCKIVGIPGSATQHLPEAYVQSLARWLVVEQQGDYTLREMKRSPSSPSQQAIVSDAIVRDQPWSLQPSLDVLFRNGVPSYVMAGVFLQSSSRSSSVVAPFTAFQWTTFANAVEPTFRILLYKGSGDGSDDLLWAQADPAALQQALGQLGVLLAEQGAAASLASGFQIVSCPLLFTVKSALSATEEEAGLPLSSLVQHLTGEDPPFLTVLATAETDAREVLTLDPSLAEMTISSLLQVPMAQFLPYHTM